MSRPVLEIRRPRGAIRRVTALGMGPCILAAWAAGALGCFGVAMIMMALHGSNR